MDRFEKIADIQAIDGKTTKQLIETLENTGLFICLGGLYGQDECSFMVMEKCTPDENKI